VKSWSHRRSKKPGPRLNISSRNAQSPSRWAVCLRRVGRFAAGMAALVLMMWGALIGYRNAAPSVARWFEVQEITLSGANQVTRREVLERLALPPHQNVLSLNPRRLAIRVQSHPWIKRATVKRLLPHTLNIEIAERRAAAVLRGPSMALLVDEEGHALSVLPPSNDPGLPVLVGINPNGVLEKEGRLLQAVQRGIELAGLLGRAFQARPEVDVGSFDNVVAYVEGLRLQFGESPFEEKWDRYQKLEPYLPNNIGAARGEIHHDVDLRYPGKVIVRERV
jgi:cell division protein FtsQ